MPPFRMVSATLQMLCGRISEVISAIFQDGFSDTADVMWAYFRGHKCHLSRQTGSQHK